ncbi:MAG: glycosyltransferase family 1 protein [Ruminococcus sp.]|nr:glycosyltransferase family 1 protein [Candidatus Copronaster equi]
MSEPIRILNLFTIMNRGGAETMVMNYYRSIDRSKVQFDFLVHRKERGAYDDEIEAMGGRIYRMCPIYPRNFRKYKKMLFEFFEVHPEYQIVHSHMSELGYFAFKEAKAHGVKCTICHAHNFPNFESETLGEKLKHLVRNYFKLRIRKYTDRMFACGEEAGIWLFGKYNNHKFIRMNNAIDSQKFRWNEKFATQLRREMAIDDNFVLVHVGRFNPQKNHNFLIDIFNLVHYHNPDAILLLVGNGELEERVKQRVDLLGLSENVRFMGLRDDVEEILMAADVFVMPSLYEGLPVSIIEAQATGIKCVISNGVPSDCIITPNVDVINLSETDGIWANTILKYANGYKRKDMCDTIVKEGFDIEENAKWLEEYYINEYCK